MVTRSHACFRTVVRRGDGDDMVRPESIALTPDEAGAAYGMNVLAGMVSAASFLGGTMRYNVTVADLKLHVVGPAEPVFSPGSSVRLLFAPASAVSVE